MPLTAEEMEQIRELIRYDAALHSSISSSLTVVIALVSAAGAGLLAWVRQRRRRRMKCPMCGRAEAKAAPVDGGNQRGGA